MYLPTDRGLICHIYMHEPSLTPRGQSTGGDWTMPGELFMIDIHRIIVLDHIIVSMIHSQPDLVMHAVVVLVK